MDKELNVSMAASTGRHCMWAPPYTANDGNIAQREIEAVEVRYVPDFMGMSGEGNNQSTDRPKGSV